MEDKKGEKNENIELQYRKLDKRNKEVEKYIKLAENERKGKNIKYK